MNNQSIYLRNIINEIVDPIVQFIRNEERIVDIVNIFYFEPVHIRQGGEILDNTNINDLNTDYEEEMNILYNMGIANNNNNELVLDLLRTNNGNIELVINTLVLDI